MTKYAIERNNKLVCHVVFRGDGLYRERDVIPLTFTKEKSAIEVASVLQGQVVDYDTYMIEDFALAA